MKRLITLIIVCAFLTEPAYALTSNSHSTDLERTSSQYWTINDASQTGLDLGTMTLAAWVKVEDAPTSGNFHGIITKWDCNTQAAYTFAYRNNGGTFQLQFETSSTGGNSGAVTKNQTLTAGTWFHVAVTYTSGTGATEIFVNGSSIGTGTALTSVFNSSTPFRIGNYNCGAPLEWDGLIDDVRVWSRALSSTDISSLYSDPCNFSNGANFVSQWLFDNNGNDNNGSNNLTNTNSATFTTDAAYSCGAAPSSAVQPPHPIRIE